MGVLQISFPPPEDSQGTTHERSGMFPEWQRLRTATASFLNRVPDFHQI